MCTVTFVARKQGYALGMNRDEQLTRVPGLPPAKRMIGSGWVLAPTEPGGGTWIALNDGGVTFALINWYAITSRVRGETVSRGQVAYTASTAKTPAQAEVALAQLPLERINPFRLIGVFPATRQIAEWRWNLNQLVRKKHGWRTRQWISSGWDEPAAQRVRSRVFRAALKQKSAGSLGWLRRLHRSHRPQAGPFSTCMHRADATTVSYTEAAMAANKVSLAYLAGSPCTGHDFSRLAGTVTT